jgi:hypothetical protein
MAQNIGKPEPPILLLYTYPMMPTTISKDSFGGNVHA